MASVINLFPHINIGFFPELADDLEGTLLSIGYGNMADNLSNIASSQRYLKE
jgi:hypothetical protein